MADGLTWPYSGKAYVGLRGVSHSRCSAFLRKSTGNAGRHSRLKLRLASVDRALSGRSRRLWML
jgi:hypothetical protein